MFKKILSIFIAMAFVLCMLPMSNVSHADFAPQSTGNLSKMNTLDAYGNPVTGKIFGDAKVTMINCWADWCGYCVREMPFLQRVHELYSDSGLQLVGLVHSSNTAKAAQVVIEREGLTYLNIMPDSVLSEELLASVTGIPMTWFVDSKGNVLSSYTVIGAKSYDSWCAYVENVLTSLGAKIVEPSPDPNAPKLPETLKETKVYGYASTAAGITKDTGWNIYDIKNGTSEAFAKPKGTVAAAEYYDGKIYAFTEDNQFVITDITTKKEQSFKVSKIPADMCYDYSTNTMYCVTSNSTTSLLYTVDLTNGSLTRVAKISGPTRIIVALACSTTGQLYGLSLYEDGLYKIDKKTCEATLIGCGSGFPSDNQALAYDHVNGMLLWAEYENEKTTSIRYVDEKTGLSSPFVNNVGRITSLFVVYEHTEVKYELGDVNRDGKVNTGDAAGILRYAASLAKLDEEQLKLGDYNNDGKVNTGDAAGILRFAAGMK